MAFLLVGLRHRTGGYICLLFLCLGQSRFVPETRAAALEVKRQAGSAEKDAFSKNGFALDHIMFSDSVVVKVVSRKFGMEAESSIPGRCKLYAEGTIEC